MPKLFEYILHPMFRQEIVYEENRILKGTIYSPCFFFRGFLPYLYTDYLLNIKERIYIKIKFYLSFENFTESLVFKLNQRKGIQDEINLVMH